MWLIATRCLVWLRYDVVSRVVGATLAIYVQLAGGKVNCDQFPKPGQIVTL